MEDATSRKKNFSSFRNSLFLLEFIIFVSIIVFFTLLFITHPSAMTCDIVPTKLWVEIFYYFYLVLTLLPLSFYHFINRKKNVYPEFHNLARILNIVLFIILYIAYSFPKGCRVYEHMSGYLIVMLVSTILHPIGLFLYSLRKDKGKV